jgi:hypothetical protein
MLESICGISISSGYEARSPWVLPQFGQTKPFGQRRLQSLLTICFTVVRRHEVLKAETLLALSRVSRPAGFPLVFRQFHYSGPTASPAEPLG